MMEQLHDSSSDFKVSKVSCYFNPSTCKYQLFSIPEKILFYMAKNSTNAKTYQKLIETCKYFFKVNPVVVVSELITNDDASSGNHVWSLRNDDKKCFEFKNPQTLHFKIWVTQRFSNYYLDTLELVPMIYRNDATSVTIMTKDQKWEELLLFAAPAEFLSITNYSIKYENGEIVPFEKIVESLPNLKYLLYSSNGDGSDFNSNTFNKLMEIEHFKNITHMSLSNIPEELNFDTMFNYILENKHVEIFLGYRIKTSDAFKEHIREYSNRLQNEEGCKSHIGYFSTYDESPDASYLTFGESSEDGYSDIFSDNFDDNDGLLFPWNNEDEEGWELPWDKIE